MLYICHAASRTVATANLNRPGNGGMPVISPRRDNKNTTPQRRSDAGGGLSRALNNQSRHATMES